MDEPEEEHEPFVMIEDDEEARLPRRLLPWLWGASTGALLVALVLLELFHGRKPAPPPPAPAVDISFVHEEPIALETSSAPDVATVDPRTLTPTSTPASAPPAPPSTPAELEVPLVVDEAPPVIEEAPAPASTLVAKAPLPAPVAPAPEKVVPVEMELAAASASIRDATPLFSEMADHFDPTAFKNADVCDLAAQMDRVEKKLREAQEIYARVRERAPDPETLERRLDTIRDLLDALQEGRARIRVPLALKRADGLREEAVPLAKEALDGFQPYSREAQALEVRAEVAAGKLRDARRLYLSVRKDVPDPERLDQRVKDIDSLLESLESRFPVTLDAR
jgi:hypothetical protein